MAHFMGLFKPTLPFEARRMSNIELKESFLLGLLQLRPQALTPQILSLSSSALTLNPKPKLKQDPDITDDLGLTALHGAAKKGHSKARQRTRTKGFGLWGLGFRA